MKEENLKTFLATLLVGGTALGAGMLALPVVTAGAGLIPTWIVYLLCWVFSIATGLLLIEVGLWMPENSNFVSMANHLLGHWGKWVAWILYIFLFYTLTIAYVAGGGGLVSQLGVPQWLSVLVFTVVFASIVYLGTKVAGRINAVLMVGLIVSFLLFIFVGVGKVNFSHLDGWSFKAAFLGLPVIFTSFSYQGVIPTLLTYLNRDPKKTRFAIIVGTSIPFAAYIIWDFIIKGIIPAVGPHGLLEAQRLGQPAVSPLQYYLPGSHIYVIGNFFAFFALTTSLIGVTLGLLDFLSDALQIEKTPLKKLGLTALIFIPPMIITWINPGIFLAALGAAGGYGCALLLGLLPTLMVWEGRYHKEYPILCKQLPGGKIVLSLLILFVVVEVGIELFQQIF